MLRYLIRRLVWAAVLFLVITFVTYVIFFIIPVDPARQVAGKAAGPADIERAAHFLGLDQPWYVQYGKFLDRLVLHQSLGESFANRQHVNDIVLAAAPVTGSLVLGGVVLWLLIALPLGIFSALRPRSLFDRGGMIFVLTGISAHPVWIGLVFSYVFGYRLGWFPITGYADIFNPPPGQPGGPVQWFWHLCLPWATFALLFAATYTRMTRSSVLETMNEDFVRTAHAKGAPEHTVLRSHTLRNALLPIVTILGMDIGLALGGAVFTETVFSLPGLGQQVIKSLENFDLPTTQGIVVFSTICILALNLAVDLLYAWVDPRIRLT